MNALADHGCRKDLDFFANLTVEGHSDRDVKQRLQLVAESGFRRVSYTEAIEILQKALQDFKPSKKGAKLFPNTDVEVSMRCSELRCIPASHWLSELKLVFCHWVSLALICQTLVGHSTAGKRLSTACMLLQLAQPGLLPCR